MARTIRAPRGTQLTCKKLVDRSGLPHDSEQPGSSGSRRPGAPDRVRRAGQSRAATGDCFDAILQSLRQLEPDETLLVQSGKPVAVFTTHEDAPRVLIANSNIVPAWATQENF